MSGSEYSLDTIARVYHDKEGVFIEVSPDAEIGDECVMISTRGSEKSKEYYGDIELNLHHEQAELLIQALRQVIDGLPCKFPRPL